MADDSLFLIDIDKILQTKAPKHYKYIPKFVVSYLKRIVHQEELNVFLRDSKDKVGAFLGVKLVGQVKQRLKVCFGTLAGALGFV